MEQIDMDDVTPTMSYSRMFLRTIEHVCLPSVTNNHIQQNDKQARQEMINHEKNNSHRIISLMLGARIHLIKMLDILAMILVNKFKSDRPSPFKNKNASGPAIFNVALGPTGWL